MSGLLVAGGSVAAQPQRAEADTAPPVAGTPATVAADALPTVQVDGVVWSQAVVGNTVYAGGKFSTARPAGAAAGTSTTPRGNLLAYDIRTGALVTSFAPTLNAQVLAVAASPDGSRLYVAGDFTTANGVTRNRVAAYSTATGQLITSFAPSLDFRARALTVTDTTVYVGGNFNRANGNARQKLAAFRADNGALLSWAPTADAEVMSMVMAPDRSRLVVGGRFTTLNGTSAYGMGAVDATSGATLPWAANEVVRNAGPAAAITSLTTDGTKIYGTGYDFEGGHVEGNFEGTFAADPSSGRILWVEDCHGDTHSSYPVAGVVYTASHAHYCGNLGGFPQTEPWTFNRALAFSAEPTGTLGHDPHGYPSFGGQPAPSLLTWWPKLDAGTVTGQSQGPWHVTGNADYVVMGGEFPRVNGVAQSGLVRFAVRQVAPNREAPMLKGAQFVPSVASLSTGTARIAWQANWDRDNEELTYKVIRDGNTAAPVFQTTARSTFWKRPSLGFTDRGLTPGRVYRYQISVSDPLGNTVLGNAVSVTAAATDTSSPYSQAVLADRPGAYWRLGEASGATAYDHAGYADLTLGSGVSRGAEGAVGGGDAASSFNGSTTASGATPTAVPGPDTFTAEAWIKTTGTSGGKILGFGDRATDLSGNYDRHVYMDDAGHLLFGVYSGGVRVVKSPATYNDGQWHHVVATMSSAGMVLYVDGKRIGRDAGTTTGQPYSGFWRVGGDNLNGWADQPASHFFTGAIDDVAVYPTALDATAVQEHYTKSGRTLTTAVRPTDAYGSAVYASGPESYWRLGESGGTVAADTSPNGENGVYSGGVTHGVAGAVPGTNTAVTLDGSDGAVAASNPVSNPTTYSQELWFKTTTTRGGKLIGFGSAQTGRSGSYDRHVYMLDDGRLRFGVWTGELNVIDSEKSYNDGVWHHLVAAQGAGGMRLYLDGALVGTHPQTSAESYTGFWRVGGDNTWGGASSDYFAGSIDEVAIHGQVLSAAQVADHYAKGGGTPANTAPTARFISSATGLSAALDGSTSSDADGTVASYAWDFGDGETGTGVKPAHTYAAAGSYTVKLTVTDDKGATDSATQTVTVTAPAPAANAAPQAAFTSTSAGLAASFDASGSTDADGTVASYAWDFGDGETGTGVKPAHTYAAAGSYTVKLTVTDDKGATGTKTSQVTVSAAPVDAPYASDAFSRTVSGGLGRADTGGAWILAGGTTNFSVTDGAGRIRMGAPGAGPSAYLDGVSKTDTEVRVAVALDKAATGGGTYVTVAGRRVSASSGYRVKLQYSSTGAVSVALVRAVAGAETTLRSATVPGLTHTPGEPLQVRLQVSGTSPTTLAAKVWKRGATEPASWLVTATDSTADLQVPGGVGVIAYLSASATNAPVVASFDDLWAGPPAAAG